jgi:prepilin-type N-terminal cleavage/methylation domain-containing protein/prepilin-type processing-associated H-X9-DG protein
MRRRRAFSLIELLVVIGIIGILASLLLAALVSAQHRSRQASCLNNLHQLGIAFTGFALDHDGGYPMRLSANLDGSKEFNDREVITNTTFSADYHHFLALSNQIPNVRVMTCPADRRKPAKNFLSFSGENLSYWANSEAAPHSTLSLLAGDRNLISVTNSAGENPVLEFDRRTHRSRGSVLFADGRVEFTRRIAYIAPALNEPEPVGNKIKPAPAENLSARDSLPARENQNSLTNNSQRTGERSVQWRRRAVSASSPAQNHEAGALRPATRASIGGARKSGGPADDDTSDEPWDTPGFRLFKFIAMAGYFVSLIWAVIVLLLYYLKWRVEQRRQREEFISRFDQN